MRFDGLFGTTQNLDAFFEVVPKEAHGSHGFGQVVDLPGDVQERVNGWRFRILTRFLHRALVYTEWGFKEGSIKKFIDNPYGMS